MSVFVNPEIVRRKESLRLQFENAQPFPHLVLDNFLDPDFCRDLMEQFPAFDAARAVNERGEVGGKAVVAELPGIGPAYDRFDRLMRSAEFLRFLEGLTGIRRLCYDPDYAGGGTHDNAPGQELDPHVDFNIHPRTRWHRRLNLLLYLNPEWHESWGGVLELHLDPRLPPEANQIVRVLPAANRCVIFETSERSWHGFARIEPPPDREGISRRSIAVYFYTRRRPRRELAPEHGTFYIPRPLPEHIAPGHTLTDEDVGMIRTLMQRRDTQIRHLYERELIWSRILNSPSHRLGRALTWPLRAVRGMLLRR